MPVNYIPHPIQAVRTTPARALDPGIGAFINVYQNLRLRPISVQVSISCTKNVVANDARAIGYTGAGANPANTEAYAGYRGVAGSSVQYAHFYLEFMVQPGLFYRVAADQGVGNVVALNEWVEIEL